MGEEQPLQWEAAAGVPVGSPTPALSSLCLTWKLKQPLDQPCTAKMPF